MKLTKRSKRQIAGLKQVITEAYGHDVTTSQAAESLINYGFLNFLKALPEIEFRENDPNQIEFSIEKVNQ